MPPMAFNKVPPRKLKNGTMTSGRRTVKGNRAVGGVDGSKHLTGEAVDYDGPNLGALLREVQAIPGTRRAFIHDGHVHGEGDWDVPYFGNRGTQ